MKKVIVTGANGFVGTAVCKELSGRGIEVIAIVRHPDEVITSIANDERIRIVYCDLSQFGKLADIIPDRDIDVFYHFAWVGSAGPLRGNPDVQMKNVQYTCDSVKACADMGCKRFVFASSIMEYEIAARCRRRWLRDTAAVYNWFMAGVPILVLLLILFYVVFAGSGLSPSMVAVVAFAMDFAAGAGRIYSTSLEAIPSGQTEAGLALGFTKLQTFFNIVLPQAAKRGLPLFRGQCINTLKGTSIVGYIAIQDLTRAGDMIRSRTFDAFFPLLAITAVYFILARLIILLLQLASPKKQAL